ncbi:MAG: sulfur carrier protein ThiS [Tannerella sp.]|jgi:sulfur carrier protein|nr:sulfur carrier protein ThiS [Tannerella sp.]
MTKIKVNGEPQEVTLPLSVADLLQQNRILQPEMVSVQINGSFVEREHFADTEIKPDDEVDFLYFMGGGQ